MTKIQAAILHTITRTCGHYTAEQVYAMVKRQHPSVAIGTVYRNLNLFADTKKIRRVQRSEGADYFERNLIPHDHMICLKCGKMSDIKISKLQAFLKENCPIDIISFDLLVNYVCTKCKEEE